MWMNVSVIHVDLMPGIELYNYCYCIYSVMILFLLKFVFEVGFCKLNLNDWRKVPKYLFFDIMSSFDKHGDKEQPRCHKNHNKHC